jgi:hypothetical protein
MGKQLVLTAVCFLALAPLACAADAGLQSDILSRYLQAQQAKAHDAQPASGEIDISASIPKLQKQGRLRALRKISQFGEVTYRVLGFQGDSSIKREVIARYLQADQQSRDASALALTPANYKFKLKGEVAMSGREAYVFQISPRKKRVGLFKGELWLDRASYLPVYEKGRLVRNPSVFFKKVDFQRQFAIRNGVAVPEHVYSTIDTRLVGQVQLDISYSNASGD